MIAELAQLGLPEEHWPGYLERLALELPGWSGMFLWRHNHPGYADTPDVPVAMLDYLAVRLVLERLVAADIVRRHWGIDIRCRRWGRTSATTRPSSGCATPFTPATCRNTCSN